MGAFGQRCQALNAEHGHLCVGIDPRPRAFPATYDAPDALEQWCLDLIEVTAPHAALFKPNLGFFLALGPSGIEALEVVVAAGRETGAMVVLDGKFADIGSTAQAYATFARDVLRADAVTLNPYLGIDAAEPFLDRDIGVFVLGRTTNPSAPSVQDAAFEAVVKAFAGADVGFVAPGTDAASLAAVRRAVGDAPLLIPGIGAQGGHADAARNAAAGGPFFVNASRSIAEAEGRFPESAGDAAGSLAQRLVPRG